MSKYDILVIGAGPVGSTFARLMAKKGFKVAILEKKKEVGVPLQCAGLTAKKITKVNILPDEFIINKVKGAYLHSPSDTILKVFKEKPEAYVLDRIGYDRYLAEVAVSEGAELLLKHNVSDVDVESGKVRLANSDKEFSADIIVGAGGHNSLMHDASNLQSKKFEAAQYQVKFEKPILDTDFVDLHVSGYVSPGFIWNIPVSSNEARIGLFGKHKYSDLNKFLNQFMNSNFKSNSFKIVKKHHGFIPRTDLNKKLFNGRSIILGDAASQVKPTTGGGLIIGFAAAEIASLAVAKAIENEDPLLLKEYEVSYYKKFNKELKNQLRVQKTFEMLNDADLDHMFLKLKEKNADELISKYGDMDDQSPLIKEFLKRGLLFSIIPSVLYRRVSEIWKSS